MDIHLNSKILIGCLVYAEHCSRYMHYHNAIIIPAFDILYSNGGCMVGVECGEKEATSKYQQALKTVSKFDKTLAGDKCYRAKRWNRAVD